MHSPRHSGSTGQRGHSARRLSADGLPLGLQLIGRPFDEATVLKVAEVMERAAGFALPDWE